MHSCLRYSVGEMKGMVAEFAKGLTVKEERDIFHSHESIFMIRKCKPILTCFVYAHSIGRNRGFISLIFHLH